MINDVFKWIMRTTLIAVFWVFALSITYNGKTLFNYANNALVQNELVYFLDGQLGDIWSKISETARVTYNQVTKSEPKA